MVPAFMGVAPTAEATCRPTEPMTLLITRSVSNLPASIGTLTGSEIAPPASSRAKSAMSRLKWQLQHLRHRAVGGLADAQVVERGVELQVEVARAGHAQIAADVERAVLDADARSAARPRTARSSKPLRPNRR
jgi:hypothetical protein